MIKVISTVAGLSLEHRNAAGITDFSSWMASEQRRIYLLCLRLLRNGDDADSATQDAFLKAYRALERQQGLPVEAPERWITRIAVNVCLDRLRSKRWLFWRRRASEEEETAIFRTTAAGSTPEDELLARDICRRLELALRKLSLRQRSIFILRHEEDRSLDEIGEIL